MRTLAIDTATPATAIAVGDGGSTYGTVDLPEPGARPGHSRLVLPLAVQALDEAGWAWRDLERIVVGRGPGTFTGLRIGIATARGLAESLGVPLLGVSTLRSVAAGTLGGAEVGRTEVVLAVLDARRREVFAAGWITSALPHGEPVLAPVAIAPAALAEWLAADGRSALAVGDGAVAFREVLEGAGAVVPADWDPRHHVDAINHLRVAGDAAGGPPEAVQPDYLRIPDAELNRRRAAESDAH